MRKFFLILLLAGNVQAQTINDYMAFTKPFEGKRHFVYKDSRGNKTIGIGHKLTKGENFFFLSNAQIENLFRQDMSRAISSAKKCVKSFDSLPHDVKLIVVDCVFNNGEAGFAKFRKTISALNTHDFIQAGEELKNSLWYKQTGRRAKNHVAKISIVYS